VPENEVSNALGFTKTTYISPAQSNVNHFNDLLRDDTPGGFLDNALKDAQLRTPISLNPDAPDPRLEKLQKQLYAHADSNDLFTIGLTWDDPKECERIVTALRNRYIEEAGDIRQASSLATATFLNSQIKDYADRMRVAENALIEYKKAHSGLLPEAQAAEIDQLSQLRTERDMLQVTSRDAELNIQAIQQRLAVIPKTTVLQQTVAADPSVIGKYGVTIQGLNQKRAALLSHGYLPDSTPVTDIDRKIAQFRPLADAEQREIAKHNENNVIEKTTQDNPEYLDLTQKLTQARIEQQTNASRLQNLDRQIGEYEARMKALPVAARELSDKTRDYTIVKQQYEELLQRREQANLKAKLDRVAATATLTPYGVVHAKTTAGAKKTLLLAIAAMVTGLAVGVGMIVLGEWMDPSLRYDGDAERYLGVPVLASLPRVGVPGGARPVATALPPAGGGPVLGIAAD
jgi:uncharacterized protein involved in exopolysaccharide biosynthesis